MMNSLFNFTTLTVLSISVSAHAIERLTPIKEPEIKEELRSNAVTAPKVWIGLAGEPVDPALAAQLGIQHGVIVELVAGGGAAEKSGIKKFDIITKIDSTDIKGMNDLRAAMNVAKVGQVVDVETVSSGKVSVKKVKLEARPEHLSKYRSEPNTPHQPQATQPHLQKLPRNLQHLPQGDRQRIEQMMQSQFQQMEKHFAQMGMQMGDVQKMQQEMQSMKLDLGDIRMKGHSNYSGTFTMMDEHGSIRLKVKDDEGKLVEVKDKAGKLLYSGPYETAEDKAAVPADIRARIDALGLDNHQIGKGFQFRFGN